MLAQRQPFFFPLFMLCSCPNGSPCPLEPAAQSPCPAGGGRGDGLQASPSVCSSDAEDEDHVPVRGIHSPYQG